ncbi:MAG: hypothetical protein SNG38_07495 [Rikenellaceae bacterium]
MKTEINFPKDIIINRIHATKVALLVAVIVLSIIMILTTVIAEFERTSIIPSITIMATIAGIIAAAIIAMSLKRKVYAPTESPLKCVVIDFAESKSSEIAKAVKDNRWSMVPQLAKNSNGAAMKLEVVYSADLGFAAYQFFSYVPHTYESCSQIFYIEKDDIKRINFVKLKS